MNTDSDSSERPNDLYEDAPCGLLSFSRDGTILKINRTLLNWLELESADVVNKKRFQDLISVGDQILFETQIQSLLKLQGAANEIQFSLITKTKRLAVLTSTTQIQPPDGKPPENRMCVFAVAERKKFETELKLERKKAEALAKSKTDFLAMLSHEIRTPLNAVIGVSDLLDSTTLSREQTPLMEMLRYSSDNLMNLLNSILDLGKIESGKIELDQVEFQITKLVESNLIAWQALAQKKGLQLRAEIDPSIQSLVVGDPTRLTQIFSNLLGNAIKFTEKGSVVLAVKQTAINARDVTLLFEVRDTGIGIPPDKLSRIFEEFQQAESNTTTRFGGTGLGLSISQKLAILFGSKIEVLSTFGSGSTFWLELTLPIGNPQADTRHIERIANQQNALSGLSVLVADDSADNRALMRHLLKKWGATAEFVANGREALVRVQQQKFDVLLMDIRMPVMSGLEAAVAIRGLADPRLKDLPILAFSGSTSFEGQDLESSDVFNEVIGKPFRTTDLIAKLLPYTKV